MGGYNNMKGKGDYYNNEYNNPSPMSRPVDFEEKEQELFTHLGINAPRETIEVALILDQLQRRFTRLDERGRRWETEKTNRVAQAKRFLTQYHADMAAEGDHSARDDAHRQLQ